MNQGALCRSIQEAPYIRVENPVHRSTADRQGQCIKRIVLASSGSKPVGEPEEVFLIDPGPRAA